jgi:hypothetical protein
MKAIKLSILCMLLSAITYCQDFNKVYRASYLVYENNAWVTKKDNYPETMFVILNKEKITITSESEQSFVVYGDNSEKKYSTHTCTTWNCYDSKGVQCQFLMKRFNDGIYVFMVLYNDLSIAFEYEILKK